MTGLRKTTKIGIKKAAIKYIAGKNVNLSYEDVLKVINDILNEVHVSVLADMEEWINEKVPKRTGQLRDNLLRNIQSSRVRDGVLRIIIATSIDYASKVNEMSTSQVQHRGTWKEHSGKWAYAYYYGNYGRIFLDDPSAVGGFFDALVEYAKERALFHLARTVSIYKGQVSLIG